MPDHDNLNSECQAILDWVAGQDIPIGKVLELPLPASLAEASQDGKLHAARTEDGRHCILLKKRIGWKSNFEGVLCCESPLQDVELIESGEGVPYVSLPGLGVFEELYVRKAHGRKLFEVYFDLN